MSTLPFNPPTPAYNNPKPEPLYFKPRKFTITGITNAAQATVSTGLANGYVVGQEVRFLVTEFFGMHQISNQLGYVLSIVNPTSFVVGINTLEYDTFIPSPSYKGVQLPQVVAVGDVNTGAINATGRTNNATTIPGAFQNTSPLRT